MSSGSLVGTGMTLQDVQMKEAQAELLLLQCWGEDSTARTDPEPSSKRHNLQEEGDHEDKNNNKWARPESKGGFGRGGRGKGNQASSQDRPSQQRQAPRRQMKDRQGKDIEGMMWMLGRLLLRHEDQMGIDKTENNFVMFFKKDSALSLVPTFVKKAEHWHSLKEQKQAKMDELALPLRTFLFHSMLEALQLRLKETTQSQDQLGTTMTLQVFLPKEENQDLMIRSFHSTQKLQGQLQGPTESMVIDTVAALFISDIGTFMFHAFTTNSVKNNLRRMPPVEFTSNNCARLLSFFLVNFVLPIITVGLSVAMVWYLRSHCGPDQDFTSALRSSWDSSDILAVAVFTS
eukprot:s1686_g8.t1